MLRCLTRLMKPSGMEIAIESRKPAEITNCLQRNGVKCIMPVEKNRQEFIRVIVTWVAHGCESDLEDSMTVGGHSW